MRGVLSNFSYWFLWAIRREFFFIFWIKTYDFFPKNFKFTIVPYGETKNLNYLENELSWSETEWNLGLGGSSSTYMGYLWPCSVQGNFRAILCTCNLKNTISKTLLLYHKSRSFQNFSWIIFSIVLTKLRWSSGFWKSEKWNVIIFCLFCCFCLFVCFFVFVNMGHNGSENFETLLLQIAVKRFQSCPEFPFQCTNPKLQTSWKWFIVERNGVKFGGRKQWCYIYWVPLPL